MALLCGLPLRDSIMRYIRCLSVCLSLAHTVKLKTENHTMFKLRGKIIYVRNSLSMTEQF